MLGESGAWVCSLGRCRAQCGPAQCSVGCVWAAPLHGSSTAPGCVALLMLLSPSRFGLQDDMTDSLRDYTNLPEAAPLLTILDMSARAKYVMDVEEITPEIVEAFVSDFLADKLKPEPI